MIPSKHETLTQCCFDVGSTAKTVEQNWVYVPCLLGNHDKLITHYLAT